MKSPAVAADRLLSRRVITRHNGNKTPRSTTTAQRTSRVVAADNLLPTRGVYEVTGRVSAKLTTTVDTVRHSPHHLEIYCVP